MNNSLNELYCYREMLNNLVRKELRTRYKGSILGFLWTFLNPLLLLLVYTVVFSTIMRVNVENFAMYLFVALLPWIFFSTTVLSSTGSIIAGKELVKKVYFPRVVLPLAVVTAGAINMLFGFVILFPCLLIFGIPITPAVICLPLLVFLLYILTLGISLITAALNVYFRDLEHILGIAMTAWFFFTPIIYPVEMIPARFLTYFFINPVAPILLAYRDILFLGQFPNFAVLGLSFISSTLILILGYNIFMHLQKNFAEDL
jgi:lipopolysaccharide transport system permease protein